MAAGTKNNRRTKWIAAMAAAATPLMVFPAVGSATPAVAEFSYLPEKARVLTLSLLPGGNDDDLQGEVCAAQRQCSSVPYPYLLRSQGMDLLDKALRQPLPDPAQPNQIVYGYSQGARVAADWLAKYAGTEGAPSPENLSFVLIGNPGRKYGGAHVGWGQTVPDSDYAVLDVARQYDMASDFPDNPLNLLALLNVFAGFAVTHTDYEELDLYDPANYVWTEGKTTYVFVPNDKLPLLEPLRWIGLAGLAKALDGPLREMIEAGYDRSYLPAKPGLPAAPAPEPEPEPDSRATPEPEAPSTDPAPEDDGDATEAAQAVQFVSSDDDTAGEGLTELPGEDTAPDVGGDLAEDSEEELAEDLEESEAGSDDAFDEVAEQVAEAAEQEAEAAQQEAEAAEKESGADDSSDGPSSPAEASGDE
ncbi:PE-PPE domain-containing protein [Mycobacterium sp. ITM-2016-00317]|uniref:PE-PPE domain-containing protein n=1 Tax=Mycobacterium sp. ITM-2016-00317 TaxID=2099694 RepID=UPI00287F99E1|nr:PE-PPE domain-containing protein [Mycobacterium sp. ITM-2016-00317]WNG85170.1 PE-PPE domain-containing protein [Mycobacterium sp. ITM-2016-00317]